MSGLDPSLQLSDLHCRDCREEYAKLTFVGVTSGKLSEAERFWKHQLTMIGAIASLAAAVDRSPFRLHARPHPGLIEDKRVLAKLRGLHQRSFSSDLPNSPE